MIIFPAIDLKDKKAVRLIQGDFKQETTYSEDPVELAKTFEKAGATHLHVVDLNGAKDGVMVHECLIAEIIKSTSLSVQVGGGIRSLDQVQRLLEIGVTEVIVGSIAVEKPELLEQMVKAYPGRIVVSIDAKDGFVLTRGWQASSKVNAYNFIKSLEHLGIKKIVYTDVSKDGMLMGPNFEDYRLISKITNIKVVASGGVSSTEDLITLNRMGLYGAIVGKAIYEHKIDLKEVITCLQKELSPV